jgi:hypothetical protein
MDTEKRARIRALNDHLRRTGCGGRVMVTRGMLDRGASFVSAAVSAMRAFDNFTENDDPYGERDFGVVRIESSSVFWKIDYYDPSMQAGAEDPSDALTCRVLTIMLAEEY